MKQKLIKMNISMDSPEQIAHFLTTAASDGYCYGGHATQMKVGGGAIYIRNYGVYTDDCLFWLNPASGGSLFHAWRIGYQSIKTSLEKELNRIMQPLFCKFQLKQVDRQTPASNVFRSAIDRFARSTWKRRGGASCLHSGIPRLPLSAC